METMRTLAGIDYAIIAVYSVFCIVLGLYYTRRASKNTNEFFLTGRSMPWWLIGASMAATNFSIDTPLAITKYVFREGIAGVWFIWSFAVTYMLATFFFARMWRKSEVMTDAEIVEKRYSGNSAASLRLFKGFYFGVIINCFVMAWVFLAVKKVMMGVTDIDPFWILVISVVAVAIYTIASGLYGVILTDFLQYFFAIFGSVALAYYAVKGHGGMGALITKLHQTVGEGSGVTNFIPSFAEQSIMPLNVFLVYIFVQWWAYKYSDGGGKHIQRMSSAKNAKHATLATFFFSIMNYAVQIWPWIIIALAAIVQFGRDYPDPEKTYSLMMMHWLPHGVLGIMVVSLIAAFMSTISTHLNLGGSYMINDIYRRFFVKDKSESHYVWMSRLVMVIALLISVAMSLHMKSVGSAWKFILSFASGAGLTWVLRWFWWRVNAWSEISAMIASGVMATTMKLSEASIKAYWPDYNYGHNILIVISVSTLIWVVVTYLTAPAEDEKLKAFVEKVRPGTLGWKRIYDKYNLPKGEPSIYAILNTIVGIVFFVAFNFSIGSFILLEFQRGIILAVIAVITGFFLLRRIMRESEV